MPYRIYLVTHHDTNMKYVGVTGKTLEERLRQHRANRTGALYDVMKTESHRITMELIEECDTREEAYIRESYYIAKYNSMRPNGYNRSSGLYSFYNDDVSVGQHKYVTSLLGITAPSLIKRKNYDLRVELQSIGRNNNGITLWKSIIVADIEGNRHVIAESHDYLLHNFTHTFIPDDLRELIIANIISAFKNSQDYTSDTLNNVVQ